MSRDNISPTFIQHLFQVLTESASALSCVQPYKPQVQSVIRHSQLHTHEHSQQPSKMTRRSLQERVERLRKKLTERQGNTVLVNDREAFDALKENLADNYITVSVATSRCCGVNISPDGTFVHPCHDDIDPLLGYAFCCEDHQKTFERNLAPSIVKTFYNIVTTINNYRPDLQGRFYIEWLPSIYVILSQQLDKQLVVGCEDDATEAIYSKVFVDPFSVGSEFHQRLLPDVKKCLAHTKVAKTCFSAFEKAVCCTDFDPLSPKWKQDNVILIPASVFNSPRSAKQSPRKSKPNTPRSAKQSPRQSPRPASPSVETPSTPSVDTPATPSAFEGLMQVLDENKDTLKSLGQSP